ncbi:nuclear receptor coactivator 7 isoform X3 [Cimex lectularius]|uniref:Oxidation resistance protein 1 n=1 Tax=Cimex lectularius TaxID=79782 RepID=A0A8I6SEQ6_CIMLE|nr:nuclear receptor coactivator 7 isoform X3 [Cimex lectularius]
MEPEEGNSSEGMSTVKRKKSVFLGRYGSESFGANQATSQIARSLSDINDLLHSLMSKTDSMCHEIIIIREETSHLKEQFEEMKNKIVYREELLQKIVKTVGSEKLEKLENDEKNKPIDREGDNKPDVDSSEDKKEPVLLEDAKIKIFLHPANPVRSSDNEDGVQSEKSFDDQSDSSYRSRSPDMYEEDLLQLEKESKLSWKQLGPGGPLLLSFDKRNSESEDTWSDRSSDITRLSEIFDNTCLHVEDNEKIKCDIQYNTKISTTSPLCDIKEQHLTWEGKIDKEANLSQDKPYLKTLTGKIKDVGSERDCKYPIPRMLVKRVEDIVEKRQTETKQDLTKELKNQKRIKLPRTHSLIQRSSTDLSNHGVSYQKLDSSKILANRLGISTEFEKVKKLSDSCLADSSIYNKHLSDVSKYDERRQSEPNLSQAVLRKPPGRRGRLQEQRLSVNLSHGFDVRNTKVDKSQLLAKKLGIEREFEHVQRTLSQCNLTDGKLYNKRLSHLTKDGFTRQSAPDLTESLKVEGWNQMSQSMNLTMKSNYLIKGKNSSESDLIGNEVNKSEEKRKSTNLSMHGVTGYIPEKEDRFTSLAFKLGLGQEFTKVQRQLSEPNLTEIKNYRRTCSTQKQLTVPEKSRRPLSADLSNYEPKRYEAIVKNEEENRAVEEKQSAPAEHNSTEPEQGKENLKRKRKISKNIAAQIANFIKGYEKSKKSEKLQRSSVSSMPGSMRRKQQTSSSDETLKKAADQLGIDLQLDKMKRIPLRKDTDGESGSRESLVERKMQPSPPIKTTTYKVESSDTLTSVAARFDTTPSELAKLNRLASRTVFPGQVIRVPDKSAKKAKQEGEDGGDHASQTASTERSDNTDEEDILETLRVNSPKPGHVERVGTPSSPHLEKFLRINVRHITDGQGVVSGTLIVTPNALMFDPNVSDPLVIERGPESYGVIAPMDYVVNAAIYNDIAHMRVGHTENKNVPKPEVYHMKSEESEGEGDVSCLLSTNQGDSRDLSAKETLPDLRSSTEEDDTCWYSGAQRDGDAFPKAFERDLVTPTNSTIDKLSDNQDTTAEDKSPIEDDRVDAEALIRATEERRKSCLDHHWAVPKHSIDNSLEREESLQEVEHEAGNEPAPVQRKTVYSDADILLAGDGEFLPPKLVQPLESNVEDDKKKQSVSFSIEEEAKKDEEKQEPKKSKMLKRLSYPLSWVEGFTGSDEKDSLPSSADSHPSHTPSSVFSISKVFSSSPINMVTDFGSGLFMKTPSEDGGKFQFPPNDSQPISAPSSAPTFSPSNIISSVGRSSVGTYMKPKLDYRSMVSVEDMPELFVSFDKLIPRPARSCEDPPLYLRLRMGKPKDKKIPKSSAIMSYGKKRMRPEYWFSVPREKVDELYKFLTTWAGHLYGELDEEEVAARGFELVDSDTELFEPDDTNGGERRASDADLANLTKESWEVLSMSGELRRALYATSVASLDLELFLPDLVGTTEILSEDHRKQLCRHLPARAEGYVWTLVFSTSQHGFSLNSMYRKMTRVESPILMVIQDTDNNVFGALTSCSLKVSDHFYGTGESLLFRFSPECQVYNWTGDNMFFIKGNNESLSIGAGDGKFGLWLDGDLYQGRSEPCATYGNEPLSPQQDFVVKTLECWAFV